MPINQRLVHLAMPSGTPLCAEGRGGTGSGAGTAAKPSLISWWVYQCHVRMAAEWTEPDTGGGGEKKVQPPILKEVSLHVVNILMYKC